MFNMHVLSDIMKLERKYLIISVENAAAWNKLFIECIYIKFCIDWAPQMLQCIAHDLAKATFKCSIYIK